jgi:hypothetical protein
MFGPDFLLACLEDHLIPVCIFRRNSLQSLAGKFWAIVIPPMAQKTRHEWGTLCVAGAGEKQRQKQPQILPSA